MVRDELETKKRLFGSVFFLANRLEALGDRSLAPHLTTKQWMLGLTVDSFGTHEPTLGEAARRMATSHQSARLIAEKLARKGFLMIRKDSRDSRALRLSITDSFRAFWRERALEDNRFIRGLFTAFTDDEVADYLHYQERFFDRIMELYSDDKEGIHV